MSRIRVAVLFGGRSGEHEVSCVSARHVAAAFDPDRYQVVPVAITRDGRWLLPEPSRLVLEGGRLEIPETAFEAAGEPVAFARGAAGPGLEVDVVFPVLHGPYGEDGTVQGLLDMAGIPYVGSGVLGSALGMDKEKMKRMFRDHGLPIGDFVAIRAHEWEEDPGRALEAALSLGLPSFAKPANLGSSVGVSKCEDEASLVAGIEEALRHDRKVLVEEAMAGREIEVGVLGNDHPEASVPGEVFPGREFYDYAAKYLDDTSRGPGRLLLRRSWPRPGGQRDQHHPGIHRHLDVPQALGGLRAALPAPARPAGGTCAGTPPAATKARGRGCAVAGGSGCHRWTIGQVRVRVMPSTAWILATTSLPRSSTVLASALTMTS